MHALSMFSSMFCDEYILCRRAVCLEGARNWERGGGGGGCVRRAHKREARPASRGHTFAGYCTRPRHKGVRVLHARVESRWLHSLHSSGRGSSGSSGCGGGGGDEGAKREAQITLLSRHPCVQGGGTSPACRGGGAGERLRENECGKMLGIGKKREEKRKTRGVGGGVLLMERKFEIIVFCPG